MKTKFVVSLVNNKDLVDRYEIYEFLVVEDLDRFADNK